MIFYMSAIFILFQSTFSISLEDIFQELNCLIGNKIDNYIIIEYELFNGNYRFYNLFYYNGTMYNPKITAEYYNDSLRSLTEIKCEGGVEHSIRELNDDTSLFKLFEYKRINNIYLLNNYIFDSNNYYQIKERKKDSIFCLANNKLYIYILK